VAQTLPEQSPPAGGVSVVIVPQKVSADDQTLPAQVLIFPAADLLDTSGRLTGAIEVRVEPALSGQALTFPAGEPPAAQGIVLSAPGMVQQYPFDSYGLSATVHANASSGDALATEASLFFRIPGWSDQGTAATPGAGTGEVISTQVVRDGSTNSIAFLLLLLMIILASIAIGVTGSATRGRMKLELSVASWLTALLFALRATAIGTSAPCRPRNRRSWPSPRSPPTSASAGTAPQTRFRERSPAIRSPMYP